MANYAELDSLRTSETFQGRVRYAVLFYMHYLYGDATASVCRKNCAAAVLTQPAALDAEVTRLVPFLICHPEVRNATVTDGDVPSVPDAVIQAEAEVHLNQFHPAA